MLSVHRQRGREQSRQFRSDAFALRECQTALLPGMRRKALRWSEEKEVAAKLSELLAHGDMPTLKTVALQHQYHVCMANGTLTFLNCAFLLALSVFNQQVFCCIFVWPLCTRLMLYVFC